MTTPSLSLSFARVTHRIRGFDAAVADLQGRVASGAIRWIEVYNVSSHSVTVHASVEAARNLSGMSQWVKDDTATGTEVGPLYTTLQAELVTLRDFVVANKQTAVDLDANGKKIEPALSAGQRTALGNALTSLKAALEAVPGVG